MKLNTGQIDTLKFLAFIYLPFNSSLSLNSFHCPVTCPFPYFVSFSFTVHAPDNLGYFFLLFIPSNYPYPCVSSTFYPFISRRSFFPLPIQISLPFLSPAFALFPLCRSIFLFSSLTYLSSSITLLHSSLPHPHASGHVITSPISPASSKTAAGGMKGEENVADTSLYTHIV